MSGDRDTWEVCMSFFPLFIELHGKEILVVGGGRIAGRRIEALLPFGCRIHVAGEHMECPCLKQNSRFLFWLPRAEK